MRTFATFVTFIALLLGTAGEAVAAANWAPRMERLASCSWDRPGHNPFMGDVVAAIDRYTDIPTLVRIRLKQRMQIRDYDDLVTIRRDEISGRLDYLPAIRDMHFGLDRVCRQVTRERWTDKMHERGLVYCEEGHCILVPTVCRNVSRIDRRPAEVAAMPQADPHDAALIVEAPSAGQPAAGSAAPAPLGPEQPPVTTPSIPDAVAGGSEPPANSIEPGKFGWIGGTGFGGVVDAPGSRRSITDGSAISATRMWPPLFPMTPPPSQLPWYQTVISQLLATVKDVAGAVEAASPPAIFCPR